MTIVPKLLPGQPGTKRWIEKYGHDLYCVRYRYDAAQGKRITTVEIVVDEREVKVGGKNHAANKIVRLRIEYEEEQLRQIVKSAGGRWNRKLKLWELPYAEVLNLGLEKRIVEER